MFSELEAVLPQWFDVCVVGAGPVGLSLSLALAAHGIRTLLLESGGDRPERRSSDLSVLASYNDDHHHSSDATVVRAIGGTSLRWGGRCVEYDDVDFLARPHVADAEWPIGHEALKPHYAAARKVLTADYSEQDHSIEDGNFGRSRESWARVPNTARANLASLRTDHSMIAVKHATATQMHLNAWTGRLEAITVAGHRKKCRIEAPYFVFAAGGRENARLLLNLQRQKEGLFGGLGGPLGRYYMGHLTGEIASITFNSTASAESLLFKSSGTGTVIRDRFVPSAKMQDKHGLLNIAMWPDSLRPDEVINGDGAISLFHMARHFVRRARDPVFRNSVSASEASSAHFRNIAAHPMQTVYGSSRLLARKLLSRERHPQFSFISPTNSYLLRYHAEHMPLSLSRVTLSDQADAEGSFRLDVDFRYAPQDFQSVVKAHTLLDNWLVSKGLGTLNYLKPRDVLEEWASGQAIDGYHQIGLTRMSRDRASGVVDVNCRTHDIANLFIAGSSVFPTSGQANPTLPAVAMSLRLADHLVRVLTRERSPVMASKSAVNS